MVSKDTEAVVRRTGRREVWAHWLGPGGVGNLPRPCRESVVRAVTAAGDRRTSTRGLGHRGGEGALPSGVTGALDDQVGGGCVEAHQPELLMGR